MNPETVRSALIILDKIFNKQKINYRVLGSVLVAALNGQPHRKLNDIDMLLEIKQADQVFQSLRVEGYKIQPKHIFAFSWIEARHSQNLGFTFLLVGRFEEKYFTYKLSQYLQLKIDNLNPKRTSDRKVVEKIFNSSIPVGQSLDQAFKIYLFGKEIPHVYSLFSQFYNLFGGLRILVGKKYEIWK